MLRILLLIFLIGMNYSWTLHAQKLQLSYDKGVRLQSENSNFSAISQAAPKLSTSSLKAPVVSPIAELPAGYTTSRAKVSGAFMPQYVRENPYGYSYLCRMELKAEDTLPIGVWLKFGEQNGVQGVPGSPANVRMKLLKF